MTETQRRPVPRLVADELETALAFLDFQRQSLKIKCEGLGEDDVRRRLVPTGTTLLWLVAHCTVGERYWFGYHVAGLDYGPDAEADFDVAFDAQPPGDVPAADVIAEYEATWARSNEIVRAIGDPDAPVARPIHGEHLPLRWVLWHKAMEIARHAGHADILREQIDGATGR